MSALVHSGQEASVPTEQADKPATSWEAVSSEVLAELQPVVEGLAKKAADQFYEETLYRIQDYLADNATFNLASRLSSADRQASYDRNRAYQAERQRDDLMATLQRLSALTPGAANAATAHDLHLTVKAIADAALARQGGDE